MISSVDFETSPSLSSPVLLEEPLPESTETLDDDGHSSVIESGQVSYVANTELMEPLCEGGPDALYSGQVHVEILGVICR